MTRTSTSKYSFGADEYGIWCGERGDPPRERVSRTVLAVARPMAERTIHTIPVTRVFPTTEYEGKTIVSRQPCADCGKPALHIVIEPDGTGWPYCGSCSVGG